MKSRAATRRSPPPKPRDVTGVTLRAVPGVGGWVGGTQAAAGFGHRCATLGPGSPVWGRLGLSAKAALTWRQAAQKEKSPPRASRAGGRGTGRCYLVMR